MSPSDRLTIPRRYDFGIHLACFALSIAIVVAFADTWQHWATSTLALVWAIGGGAIFFFAATRDAKAEARLRQAPVYRRLTAQLTTHQAELDSYRTQLRDHDATEEQLRNIASAATESAAALKRPAAQALPGHLGVLTEGLSRISRPGFIKNRLDRTDQRARAEAIARGDIPEDAQDIYTSREQLADQLEQVASQAETRVA